MTSNFQRVFKVSCTINFVKEWRASICTEDLTCIFAP